MYSKVKLALVAIALLYAGFNTASAQAQNAAAAGDSGNGAPGQLEQVIVTAQRRDENIQTVPVAVTYASGASLRNMGVANTSLLGIAAPAVTLNQSTAGGASVTIRGVISSGSLGDESASGVYVDGVYLAGTPGLYFGLANVDHIEVLKGPQGTLFGRNSAGGAIQIITRNPEQTPGMELSAGYGNYGTAQGQFYGTTGLDNHTAVDLSLYGSNQSQGWGRNIFTGQDAFAGDEYAVRSKLLWEAGDTRIVLAVSYSSVKWPSIQGDVLLPGQLNKAGIGYEGFYAYDGNIPDVFTTTQATVSLTASQRLSFARLTSISSWEDTSIADLFDGDYSRFSPSIVAKVSDSTRKYTEELQLASLPSSKIDWIGGLYYFSAIQARTQANSGASTSFVDATEPVKSYAAYGQTTAEVLPRTKLTLGVRYTLDDHLIFSDVNGTFNPHTDRKDDAFTYRVALSNQLTPDIMIYASSSSGFKSGLFSLAAPTAPAARPANLYADEVGFKGEFWGRLRLNAAIFYDDYSDVQVKAYVVTPTGEVAETINAPTAYAKGLDLDAEFRVTDSLTLRGGLSYLDSRYGSFPNAQCYFPKAYVGGLVSGWVSHSCSATRNHTEQSPEFVYSISADYRRETPIGEFQGNITTNYNSGYYLDAQNIVPSGSYQLLNASVRWQPLRSQWGLKFWVNNAGDARHLTSAYEFTSGFVGAPSAPRTYGLTLDYKI